MSTEGLNQPGSFAEIDWKTALERLITTYLSNEVSSTSKWDKNSPQISAISYWVRLLFEEDYDMEHVDNENGQFCGSYPLRLHFIKSNKNKQFASNPTSNPSSSSPLAQDKNKHMEQNTGTTNGTTYESAVSFANRFQNPCILTDPLILGSRHGRARTRFPVPVMQFRGKNICRSSSLSLEVEAIGHSTFNSIKSVVLGPSSKGYTYVNNNSNSNGNSTSGTNTNGNSNQLMNEVKQNSSNNSNHLNNSSSWNGNNSNNSNNNGSNSTLSSEINSNKSIPTLKFDGTFPEIVQLLSVLKSKTIAEMDKVRIADSTMLKLQKITHILDLMTEDSKKVIGFSVTTSEKSDSYKRYDDFTLLVFPYPGVEFFREVNVSKLCSDASNEVMPSWNGINPVSTPRGSIFYDWNLMTSWNINTLTCNYFRTILYTLCDSTCDGLLVHCISGWDRTPMFVSLIRLSLWADGEIHPSLSPEQILYLTLAYDWMLFRHHLESRQLKMEDIFGFCFRFLECIMDDEYSVSRIMKVIENESLEKKHPDPSPTFIPKDNQSLWGNFSFCNPHQAFSSSDPSTSPPRNTQTVINSNAFNSPASARPRVPSVSIQIHDQQSLANQDNHLKLPPNQLHHTHVMQQQKTSSSSPPQSLFGATIIGSYKNQSFMQQAASNYSLSSSSPPSKINWTELSDEEDDMKPKRPSSTPRMLQASPDDSLSVDHHAQRNLIHFGDEPLNDSSHNPNQSHQDFMDMNHHLEMGHSIHSDDSSSPSGSSSVTFDHSSTVNTNHSLAAVSPPLNSQNHNNNHPVTIASSSSSHTPVIPLSDHPIIRDDNNHDSSPINHSSIPSSKPVPNERRRKLTAVQDAFFELYANQIHPHYEYKRKAAQSGGLWSWVPSFGFGK